MATLPNKQFFYYFFYIQLKGTVAVVIFKRLSIRNRF